MKFYTTTIPLDYTLKLPWWKWRLDWYLSHGKKKWYLKTEIDVCKKFLVKVLYEIQTEVEGSIPVIRLIRPLVPLALNETMDSRQLLPGSAAEERIEKELLEIINQESWSN